MSTTGPQAPHRLEIIRRFVNTDDVESRDDALTGTGDLEAWLRAAGLLDAPATATAAQLRRARTLRDALRAAMAANHGDRALPATAAAALNAVAHTARLGIWFSTGPDLAVRPREGGIDGALGALVAIVAEAMADGTWRRMKVCVNDACRWAFYDHSRAQSGKWCSMRVCGNRAKQQTWRARREPGPGTTAPGPTAPGPAAPGLADQGHLRHSGRPAGGPPPDPDPIA